MGQGRIKVGITWGELQGKCMVMLKSKSCDVEEKSCNEYFSKCWNSLDDLNALGFYCSVNCALLKCRPLTAEIIVAKNYLNQYQYQLNYHI